MSEFTPIEIFNRFKRKELDKSSAVQDLISFVDISVDNSLRLEALMLLGKMNLRTENIFKILENILVSEVEESLRGVVAKLLAEDYFGEGDAALLWASKHEKSVDLLLRIHTILEYMGSIECKFLMEWMENIIGRRFMEEFKVLSREAMGLELLQKAYGDICYFNQDYAEEFYINISIKGNKITELSFKVEEIYYPNIIALFPNLKTLRFYNTDLRNKDLKFLRNLELLEELYIGYVALDEPQIEDIQNIPNLKVLSINYIELSDFYKFKNFNELKYLDLSNNYRLTRVPDLGDLNNLERLDLSYNLISEIEGLSTLRNLKYLNLSNNKIIEIKGLENLVNLAEFHISSNNLVKDDYFSSLTPEDAQKYVEYCREQKRIN